jgi:hypothetical protein
MASKNSHIEHLHQVCITDPDLNSYEAKEVFSELNRLGFRDLWCIILNKPCSKPYIKFCLNRGELGKRAIEMGLFYLHSKVGDLRVRTLNRDLDWKVVMRHLPCTSDLVWIDL